MPRLLLLLVVWALAGGSARAATTISFWHALVGADRAELNSLVARFNASQRRYRVVARYRGPYEGTLGRALAAHRAGRGPRIVEIYDAATADALAAGDALVPLWKVMREAGIALAPRAYVPAVASYYSDGAGRLLALPFDVSTPVLYYNRDAFRAAGLDPDRPPRTWEQMVGALGALVRSRGHCAFTTAAPSWVLLENMSAWHGEAFATQGNGLDGAHPKLSFNTDLGIRWIAWLSTWRKSGYYTYTGRRRDGVRRFAAGDCAVLAASSARYAAIARAAKFDLGVAQFPYFDDLLRAPQNTLPGGSSLWVMASRRRAEMRGAARFLAFLMRPEIQLEWHQKTGYVPLVVSAYGQSKEDGFYRSHPAAEFAVRQLLFRSPIRDTRGIRLAHFARIRRIIDEELEAVWRGRALPIPALNDAVKRGNALLAAPESIARR